MKVEQKVAKVLSEGYPSMTGWFDRAGTRGPAVSEYTDLTKRAKSLNALVSRWLEGVDLEANTVYVVTGFGNGAHIVALLDRLPKSSFVFCTEARAETLTKLVDDEVVDRVFNDKRVFIGVGDVDAAFFQSLSRFPSLEITNARPLIFPPLYSLYPEKGVRAAINANQDLETLFA